MDRVADYVRREGRVWLVGLGIIVHPFAPLNVISYGGRPDIEGWEERNESHEDTSPRSDMVPHNLLLIVGDFLGNKNRKDPHNTSDASVGRSWKLGCNSYRLGIDVLEIFRAERHYRYISEHYCAAFNVFLCFSGISPMCPLLWSILRYAQVKIIFNFHCSLYIALIWFYCIVC